jgi:hypothetical protein
MNKFEPFFQIPELENKENLELLKELKEKIL